MNAIHHPHHLHATNFHNHNHQINKNRVRMVDAYQDVKTSKKSKRLGETLSNLLNIQKPYQKINPIPSTHSNWNVLNIHEDKAKHTYNVP
ncbi:hypothetical protein P3S67_029636 [Capsicum chacoense]